LHNLLKVGLLTANYIVRQMLVMREAWQARKVWRTVIAKEQTILFILAVIAVIKRDKAVFYYHDGFVNFQ
jgi:hypothetical protein